MFCLLQTLERQAAARRSLQWRPSRALGQGNRLQVTSLHSAIPEARGLYDPANDKDACGVGFIGRHTPQICLACSITRFLSTPLIGSARMCDRGT